jgi:hypothetical protein
MWFWLQVIITIDSFKLRKICHKLCNDTASSAGPFFAFDRVVYGRRFELTPDRQSSCMHCVLTKEHRTSSFLHQFTPQFR